MGCLFLTIVGIPVAIAMAKSLGTYLNPVGKVCVPKLVADAVDRQKGEAALKKYGFSDTPKE